MTNGNTYLDQAINALNDGRLSAYEAEFIEKIRDYSKKELNKLNGAQYNLLRTCAAKA